MQHVRVLVQTSDPVSRAGIEDMLRSSSEIDLVTEDARASAEVVVLAEQTVGAGRLHSFNRMRADSAVESGPRCVVVTDHFDSKDTMLAVRCGVMSILPAACVAESHLVTAVIGATHAFSLFPRSIQAALLSQLDEVRSTLLEPNGLTLSRLGVRERDMIGLVADGYSTDEIATRVGCSEGTVKGTLHAAMRRLGLSNRAHAVAYAYRSGALT